MKEGRKEGKGEEVREEGRGEKRKIGRRKGRKEGREETLGKDGFGKEKKNLNKQQQLCLEINLKVPEGIAAGIKTLIFIW